MKIKTRQKQLLRIRNVDWKLATIRLLETAINLSAELNETKLRLCCAHAKLAQHGFGPE
jgi:hypothetical protein